MALPGLFPIYPDPTPLKYQVSLALPPLAISKISQSIGITASSSFLTPNIDFLQKFISGDLGIADKITKEAMFKTFNSSITQKDDKIFKKFAEITNTEIPDIESLKKDGKIRLPKELVQGPKLEGIGFKGLEKTLLTSIYETQKPYLEIAKLVIGNLAKIEDIIARTMPLLGVPLKTKSLKPVNNAGSNNRPKALGYAGGVELKNALANLQKLSKTISEETSLSVTQSNISDGKSDNESWKIISTVYSTGIFIPGISYKYTYIDLPPEKSLPDETSDLNLEDDDPYNKYKPEKIIFGIFKSDGTPLDPREKLKSVSLNSDGQIVFTDTIYNKADWLLNSSKWQMENIFPNKKNSTNNQLLDVFPSFSTPIYKWQKNQLTQNSKTKPGDGWSIKKYKKNQKNILDRNTDAIEDNPIIVGFDPLEISEYKNYFTDIVKYKIQQTEELSQIEKDQYTKEIIDKLNIQSHIENVFIYSQNKSSVYKEINGSNAFPESMRLSFKPFQLYSESAEGDIKLSSYNISQGKQPGYIWIDPESDYDTKVIRIDPTTQIEFQESKGEPRVKSSIKSFVKNKTIFQLSNTSVFTIEISKNNETPSVFTNITSYTLENWNYYKENILSSDIPQIQNNNSYSITIYSNQPDNIYSKLNSNKFFISADRFAELNKIGNDWVYKEYITTINGDTEYPVKNGKKTLDSGTIVEVTNNKITKWYYLEQIFDKNNLPVFGSQITYTIDYLAKPTSGNYPISVDFINIPTYQIKVEDVDFPFGKIIDPSKILNEQLTTEELFSKGRYGSGDNENPQEIEVIKRYMLTDLDTESYYIIEGVLSDKNTQDNDINGKGSGSYYKLPHALGATKVFVSLLVDIVSKLIPSIVKLIELFKNPASFVSEIIKEKIGDGFSIFSKEAFTAFENAKKESIKLNNDFSEKEKRIKNIFRESPLVNHVYVTKKGDYKFLLDGLAMLPFEIFGIQIPFGMEFNFDKIPESPINLVTKDLPLAKVKNLQDFLKPKLKDTNISDNKVNGLNLSDLKAFKEEPIYKIAKSPASYSNPNDFEIIDIKYSTGRFINGVDYNYIYIDLDTEKILKNAEDILNKKDSEIDITQSQKYIEELSDALKKEPNNQVIKDLLSKLKNRIMNLKNTDQPLLKFLLGLVTLPMKIIAGIIEWLMDFFKSLSNPLTLPSKISELLSFNWIMKFFTPLGILELAGIVFKPEEIVKWCNLTKIPNTNPPNISTQVNGINLSNLKFYKDANPRGRYLIPDDAEVVDWSQILSIPFISNLPVYTAKMQRDMCNKLKRGKWIAYRF